MLSIAVLIARPVAAEEVAVPVGLQAELMVKVAAYDRNLPARAGDRVRVMILTKAGDADSLRAGAQMTRALSSVPAIGGIVHEEIQLPFKSGAELRATCTFQRISIVYVTPGFGNDVDSIVSSLTGVDVLTVSAVAEYVPRGLVLGFDLVSGKPKLLANLGQARRQNVALKAEVLKLMRVYE